MTITLQLLLNFLQNAGRRVTGKLAAEKRSEIDFPVLNVFSLNGAKIREISQYTKKMFSTVVIGTAKKNRHPLNACCTYIILFFS
jgi:hypothetical protein